MNDGETPAGRAEREDLQQCAGARPGIDVEVAPREPGVKGFKVIPRSRLVERTFGRLVHRRRLTRDHETHPHRSETTTRVVMIDLMSRDTPAARADSVP